MSQSFYQNLNFSFLGQIFQYYLLGLKVWQLRFASFSIRAQVLKSVLLSLYLLFPVIILSCSFCVLYCLFLFCDVHQVKIMLQVPKKNWKKKKRRQKREEKKKKKLFVVSILLNQNIFFLCPLPLIHYFCNIFLLFVLV